jgi:hypothetical protein
MQRFCIHGCLITQSAVFPGSRFDPADNQKPYDLVYKPFHGNIGRNGTIVMIFQLRLGCAPARVPGDPRNGFQKTIPPGGMHGTSLPAEKRGLSLLFSRNRNMWCFYPGLSYRKAGDPFYSS